MFDAQGKTFRDDWYPEYKANRAADARRSRAQIEPLHELVRAQGWPLLMVDGVEADDVIGTLADAGDARPASTRSSRPATRTSRSSSTPGVTLVNTMTNETLDDAGVLAKFGVRAGPGPRST